MRGVEERKQEQSDRKQDVNAYNVLEKYGLHQYYIPTKKTAEEYKGYVIQACRVFAKEKNIPLESFGHALLSFAVQIGLKFSEDAWRRKALLKKLLEFGDKELAKEVQSVGNRYQDMLIWGDIYEQVAFEFNPLLKQKQEQEHGSEYRGEKFLMNRIMLYFKKMIIRGGSNLQTFIHPLRHFARQNKRENSSLSQTAQNAIRRIQFWANKQIQRQEKTTSPSMRPSTRR